MKTFDFQFLLNLKNFEQKFQYLEECNLNKIANSAERSVFKISEDKVLKISNLQFLSEQNKNVIQNKKIFNKYDCFPKIYDCDYDTFTAYIEDYAQSDSISIFSKIFYDNFSPYQIVQICSILKKYQNNLNSLKEKIINLQKLLIKENNFNILINEKSKNNIINYIKSENLLQLIYIPIENKYNINISKNIDKIPNNFTDMIVFYDLYNKCLLILHIINFLIFSKNKNIDLNQIDKKILDINLLQIESFSIKTNNFAYKYKLIDGHFIASLIAFTHFLQENNNIIIDKDIFSFRNWGYLYNEKNKKILLIDCGYLKFI